MLHVERGPDVDARVEQFLDVLPTFGMPAVGRVGVGEFVDDDQFRATAQRGFEIELLDPRALDIDDAARQNFEIADQRLRLGAAMRFDDADDDVAALALQRLRALQHRVGLADAGRRAEKHEQPAALPLLGQRQEGIRVGTALRVSFVAQDFNQPV